MRIVHLSSAHARDDTRIFVKQCRSLAARGCDVTLVVADGRGDDYRDGVRIVDVGNVPGRVARMLRTTGRVVRRAREIDAAIYHLHDPELIPFCGMLQGRRSKIVFDAHEDLPKQLSAKPYLAPILRRVLPVLAGAYERRACRRLGGVVAATSFIFDKFLAINRRTVEVNNFPRLDELEPPASWACKKAEVCYIGGLSAIRGAREMVRACELVTVPVRLNLAGHFSGQDLRHEVKRYPGWSAANELGYLDRAGVRAVLRRSMAGLVTLHPTANYREALPVKMFEYMAAGIPVIASNIPLWRDIVDGLRCGLCVDPRDPRAIAGAIDCLLSDPVKARQMGQNGRRAVAERYNWAQEERKLWAFYGGLQRGTWDKAEAAP